MIQNRLNQLQRTIAESVAKLIPGYIETVRKAAAAAGYRRGYTKGYEEGRWVIEDRRKAVTPAQTDKSIYGPAVFPVTPNMCDRMRQEVSAAVARGTVVAPTESQWKMILTNSPSTRVIAGAGSGKSTTLILRVVFLLKHLKIPMNEITVVSFTRDSCKELRESLCRISQSMGVPVRPIDAESVVRTFHSMLYRVAKKAFGEKQFFELAMDNSASRGLRQPNAVDVENPFSSAGLSATQVLRLKQAYTDLYVADPKFRESIFHLFRRAYVARSMQAKEGEKGYRKNILKFAEERDVPLVRQVNARLKERGLWPAWIREEGPIRAFDASGFQFYANARVGGLLLVFGDYRDTGNNHLFGFDETVDGYDFSIGRALAVKKNIAAFYADTVDCIHVDDSMGMEWVRLRAVAPATDKEKLAAPMFDVQLAGEAYPVPVYEAFLAQAGFIESLGMEVTEAVIRMGPFRDQSIEYYFVSALARFWPAFEGYLAENGTMTFNRAFLLMTRNEGQAGHLPTSVLKAFKNLLVDEFQDISPQIVNWLTNMQRHLRGRLGESDGVTLMAIGDDWQSIYGWRGSAPELFVNFDRHFLTHKSLRGGKALECRMEENFRSIGPILRDAGMLLESVSNKTPKTPRAMVPAERGDHGVNLVQREDPRGFDDSYILFIAERIREELQFAASRPDSHKNKVIILCRTRKVRDKLREELNGQEGLAFYTYHSAKGLQGEVAILVEDCDYVAGHVLRNKVYDCSGLFSPGYSYDTAVRDEALRLAYVGVTRGRRRVLWFVDALDGAANCLVEAGIKPQLARLGTEKSTSASSAG